MGLFKKDYVKVYLKKTGEIMDFIRYNGLNKDPRIERELYAFTFLLADIIFEHDHKNRYELTAQIKRKLNYRFAWFNLDEFDKRVDFYTQFINGKIPRAFNVPLDLLDVSNAVTRVVHAFEDMLYSPNLIDDYDNSPVFSCQGLELVRFLDKMAYLSDLLGGFVTEMDVKL